MRGAVKKGDSFFFFLNPINPRFHQNERADLIDEARYIAFDVCMGLIGMTLRLGKLWSEP